MPTMPYNLERGPYLAMLEDLINRDPWRCLDTLRDPAKPVTALLRDPPVPIKSGPYHDTAAAGGPHRQRLVRDQTGP